MEKEGDPTAEVIEAQDGKLTSRRCPGGETSGHRASFTASVWLGRGQGLAPTGAVGGDDEPSSCSYRPPTSARQSRDLGGGHDRPTRPSVTRALDTMYEVVGPLIALNACTRYFELEDRSERRRMSGRLERGQLTINSSSSMLSIGRQSERWSKFRGSPETSE